MYWVLLGMSYNSSTMLPVCKQSTLILYTVYLQFNKFKYIVKLTSTQIDYASHLYLKVWEWGSWLYISVNYSHCDCDTFHETRSLSSRLCQLDKLLMRHKSVSSCFTLTHCTKQVLYCIYTQTSCFAKWTG